MAKIVTEQLLTVKTVLVTGRELRLAVKTVMGNMLVLMTTLSTII